MKHGSHPPRRDWFGIGIMVVVGVWFWELAGFVLLVLGWLSYRDSLQKDWWQEWITHRQYLMARTVVDVVAAIVAAAWTLFLGYVGYWS